MPTKYIKIDPATFYKDATPEKLARALLRPLNRPDAPPTKPKRKRRQKSGAASAKHR